MAWQTLDTVDFDSAGLRAQRVGEGLLHVPDRQPADERGDDQGLQGVRLGHVVPNSLDANSSVVPPGFGRGTVTGPAVVLTVAGLYPLRMPGRASTAAAERW